MARSSRHKSHRSHKHRDRSESDEEWNSRDRKMKVEEEESARVSRVSDQEKRKSSSKDGVGTSNGDVSGDHGKKRKDRGENSGIGGDRWNGGGDDDVRVEKELKKEGSDAVEVEKSSKSKSLAVDLKGKSSSGRRREGSNEKNEEKRRERSEEKRRSEKETSRRESSSSQYKDGKEKENERERERERERGSEKEKKVQDSRHERSDDAPSRREEHSVKQGVEISDLRDEMHTTEVEKELDKYIKRRRDGSADQDRLDDVREGDDRQVSSRDDYSKNGSYKDGRYKEKYREELDRDQRHRDDKRSDDKRRDERSSRTHTSEGSESKHYRGESRVSESHDKKTKLQDSERDSSRRDSSRRGDDHSTKLQANRGRKRSSDENDDQNDMKPRGAKEPREGTPKNGSSSGKLDSRSDRARMEHPHINKVDSSLSNSRTKNSPNSSAYTGKDQNKHNSRPVESTRRESLSEDTRRSGAGSRDHAAASGGRERMSESRTSDKAKLRDNIRSDAYITDGGSVPHHDRILRSDTRSSPNQLTEKSPTCTSERQSDRITARRNLDIDGGQRSSSSKGGRGDTLLLKVGGREREYLAEKPNEDATSQVELPKREHVSVGASSNRNAQLQGSSPGRLPPPPPVRYGVDSPSVLGSCEDDTRVQNGERKVNNRYKRDASVGRGPGTPWKGAPTWPSPVANGFMSLPHGPPGGFHPAIQQFPAPPVFGIRPSMDLSNASYHIHETGNRFPGHARPYGWHNPVDDCPPQLQVWDGNTNVFSDESHIYGRQEWDQNRHMLGSRGWEMSDIWNAQNGNANMEFPVPHKANEYPRQALANEAWVGQPVHNSHDERARSEQPTADGSGIKLPSDASPAKQAVRVSLKSLSEKTLEPSNMSSVNRISKKQSDNNVLYCRTYLSKLDISRDLVRPELYKQFMSLMEVRERNVTGNVPSLGQRKSKVGLNVEGFRLVAKSKQCAYNSFLPTATDATFQRAMALYRKQREGLKEATRLALPSVCPEGQNNPPESNDEKVAAKSITPMEEGLPANAVSSDYMDEDNNAAADVEGEHPQNSGDTEEKLCDDNKPSDTKAQQVDNPSNAEEKRCDKIYDAVMSVEGSEESEAIIPECRVNLSRIHLSPAESTH